MRELTEKEKELLVDGIPSLSPVFITAPDFGIDFGFSFDLWSDNWNWEQFQDYWDGGGGGSESYQCNSLDPATTETYVDAMASEIARAIIAKSDHTRAEYLAFVYRDGQGTIRTTELSGESGDRVQINFHNLGFPASQVLAIIHNHDMLDYGGSTQAQDVNRLPSAKDWNAADTFAGLGANSNTLSFYLLDTQDGFRQYNSADRSRYVQSDGSIKLGAPLGNTASKTLLPTACPL